MAKRSKRRKPPWKRPIIWVAAAGLTYLLVEAFVLPGHEIDRFELATGTAHELPLSPEQSAYVFEFRGGETGRHSYRGAHLHCALLDGETELGSAEVSERGSSFMRVVVDEAKTYSLRCADDVSMDFEVRVVAGDRRVLIPLLDRVRLG